MFVILDGEAQFTVDGRTSTLKGPAGAPARMGHSHAIYNATDKPVQWLNINVASFRGIYDNFDLGDDRVGAPLDPVPQFISMQLDPVAPAAGRGPPGRHRNGAVSARAQPLGFLHDLGLRRSPAAAAGHLGRVGRGARHRRLLLRDERRRHRDGGRRYRADQIGDAIPVRVGETRAFENSGTAPLEFLVVGVARDMNKKNDLLATPPQRPGGPGRAGGAGRGL